jgi:Hemerythrin HHE cation binding domain
VKFRARKGRPAIPDLRTILADEHQQILVLLDDLATNRHDRFPLAHQLIDALAAHTAAEQQLLYPALRDIVPGGIEMADRAQVEHQAMRRALVALEDSHPGDAAFEQALVDLRADLAAHVPVEENDLLPALTEVIGADKMEELGVLYIQIRDSLPTGLQSLAADIPDPEFRTW